jgi:hypothetical protein
MRKRNSGVINAKNVIYFSPDKFQYPSVQEPKTHSQKQKDRAEFHRNRLKEREKKSHLAMLLHSSYSDLVTIDDETWTELHLLYSTLLLTPGSSKMIALKKLQDFASQVQNAQKVRKG